MVLESTIVCIDNSEFSRNGDFAPNRYVSAAATISAATFEMGATYLISGVLIMNDEHGCDFGAFHSSRKWTS